MFNDLPKLPPKHFTILHGLHKLMGSKHKETQIDGIQHWTARQVNEAARRPGDISNVFGTSSMLKTLWAHGLCDCYLQAYQNRIRCLYVLNQAGKDAVEL